MPQMLVDCAWDANGNVTRTMIWLASQSAASSYEIQLTHHER